MIWLRFESRLCAEPPVIWLHVTTMRGVNAELLPLVRMSSPKRYDCMTLREAPRGELLFHSWLLLFGLLPFDRHALSFESIWDYGFQEHSSSWLQRQWRHRRVVELLPGGARLVDELEIVPRFAPPWLVRFFVACIFRHRHRRLRRHFGSLD
ncbi:hypothetical protein [Solimonas soli]|uniref:hypothetical protein n=1 Tax=Solimonas soli TaxID=413479 RepID=UPI000486BF42|nr:hypothetical protein [Solimonas soli]